MKTESALNISNAHQSAHPFVIPDRPEPDGPFYEGRYSPGLTKLELLAGMAMRGLLANRNVVEDLSRGADRWLAPTAIHCASALLSELEKQKGLK